MQRQSRYAIGTLLHLPSPLFLLPLVPDHAPSVFEAFDLFFFSADDVALPPPPILMDDDGDDDDDGKDDGAWSDDAGFRCCDARDATVADILWRTVYPIDRPKWRLSTGPDRGDARTWEWVFGRASEGGAGGAQCVGKVTTKEKHFNNDVSGQNPEGGRRAGD